eukprot:12519592-Alexandrium_andersonii.AAC.1
MSDELVRPRARRQTGGRGNVRAPIRAHSQVRVGAQEQRHTHAMPLTRAQSSAQKRRAYPHPLLRARVH